MLKNEIKMGARHLVPAMLLLAAILFCPAAMDSRAQDIPAGSSASDFNSVEYFEPPNQQQIKSRMSGSEADPLPSGMLLIKQLRLETYDAKGNPQLIADAPECIYDPINGVASSPGAVHMQTGNGEMRMDGEGFLWRQSVSFLTISNQVQTVIVKAPAISQ
jgi:hypothetical protein